MSPSPVFSIQKLELHTPPTPLERGGEVLASMTLAYGALTVAGAALARGAGGPFLMFPRLGSRRRVVVRCADTKAQLLRAALAAYRALAECHSAVPAGRDGSPMMTERP
ncbi:hypothetical protein [Paracraurococcus lichenis]|uniref:Uncharacterized protein n=1 Tax=Paracraurococcus lichenis TaxID=3064888 RepID=A0ABT9ECX5_9PROT|nr:hypothetical protein [Paracraurococcus sp. LOR1-02]MDO9713828.1 hypothetical protein [Paracraurococcus sp. LOR1-02]